MSPGHVGAGIDPLNRPPPVGVESSQRVRPARVEVRIDQLVLEGFAGGDAEAASVAAAVQRELGRLLSEGRHEAEGGNRDRVDAGAIEMPKGGSPELLGARIARAVLRGVAIAGEGTIDSGRAVSREAE